MAAGTFTVRGRKFRTGTTRRYVVVEVSPALGGGSGVRKRSDQVGVALAEKRRLNGRGVRVAVVDTTTGGEVC